MNRTAQRHPIAGRRLLRLAIIPAAERIYLKSWIGFAYLWWRTSVCSHYRRSHWGKSTLSGQFYCTSALPDILHSTVGVYWEASCRWSHRLIDVISTVLFTAGAAREDAWGASFRPPYSQLAELIFGNLQVTAKRQQPAVYRIRPHQHPELCGPMEMGGAAALYAGSVLLRKTFEAVAQRSVSSLFSRLHVRFRGQRQLEQLQKDLESRLQVLSLPVDICVHYVLHGSTALEGALDMALRVINDIISFQEELEAQAYNESIPKVSQAEAAIRLEGFLSQLDSLLPYLSMAINSVSLLQRTNIGLSPSRLMEASYLIRNAGRNQGVVMSVRAKLYKYETHVTLPHWQEKLMACNVKLRHSVADSSAFELVITAEDESDSTDSTESLVLPVAEVAAIGSSTLHVLGLGEHDLEAVLLLDMDKFTKSSAEKRSENFSLTPLKDNGPKLIHYAIRCVEEYEEETSATEEQLSDSDGESNDHQGPAGNPELPSRRHVMSRTKISKLSTLQYAIWLCMLQMREEREHWCLPDERIGLFFSDPRYVSEAVPNVQKSSTTGNDSAGLTTRLTPGAPRTLNRMQSVSSSGSRPSSTRSTISELFYDLNIDSPVAKS